MEPKRKRETVREPMTAGEFFARIGSKLPGDIIILDGDEYAGSHR